MTLKKAISLSLLLLVAMLSFAARPSEPVDPRGEGMPLPWPFPWAGPCSVDWASQSGRYLLIESAAKEEIDFNITVVDDSGTKLAHMSHYANDGTLLEEGSTYIDGSQKVVRLWLLPSDSAHMQTRASLRLHYRSEELLCDDDKLVPILTLEHPGGGGHTQLQYSLGRVNFKK